MRTALAIVLAFIAVQFYPLVTGSELVDRGGLQDLSNLNSRTIYWQVAFSSIKENPLWGTGLGTFEWSGIKEVFPFQYIPSVHNDYLQWWLELGIFWAILLTALQIRVLWKTFPIELSVSNPQAMEIKSSEQAFLSWVMLVLISMYMVINFIVGFLIFQLLIALLVTEVLSDE